MYHVYVRASISDTRIDCIACRTIVTSREPRVNRSAPYLNTHTYTQTHTFHAEQNKFLMLRGVTIWNVQNGTKLTMLFLTNLCDYTHMSSTDPSVQACAQNRYQAASIWRLSSKRSKPCGSAKRGKGNQVPRRNTLRSRLDLQKNAYPHSLGLA